MGADPPVVAVQRAQQRHEHRRGEVLVEPVLVDGVVAGEPPPEERGHVADLVEEAVVGDVAERLERVHRGAPAATVGLVLGPRPRRVVRGSTAGRSPRRRTGWRRDVPGRGAPVGRGGIGGVLVGGRAVRVAQRVDPAASVVDGVVAARAAVGGQRRAARALARSGAADGPLLVDGDDLRLGGTFGAHVVTSAARCARRRGSVPAPCAGGSRADRVPTGPRRPGRPGHGSVVGRGSPRTRRGWSTSACSRRPR